MNLFLAIWALLLLTTQAAMYCPVCGMPVTVNNSFVEVTTRQNYTSQKIYTCSVFHAQRFAAHPIDYKDRSSIYVYNATVSPVPVQPLVRCPFCNMNAVIQNSMLLQNGQTLFTCGMPNHYPMLFNETLLVPKFNPVAGVQDLICPVCGMSVTTTGPYVEVNSTFGVQKVYTCCDWCSGMLVKDPLSYRDPNVSYHAASNITVIQPIQQCPFCKMSAVQEHALYFIGGQMIHSCLMTSHFALLTTNTTALSAKLVAVSVATPTPIPAHISTVTPIPVSTSTSHGKCPVCGMTVTDTKNRLSLPNGQNIYACSASHATLADNNYLSFVTSSAPSHKHHYTQEKHKEFESASTTPVVPTVTCPFCPMDGIIEHPLNFMYGQTVYACAMTDHYANLYNPTIMKATLQLVTAAATTTPAPWCLGSGTVMLNGFTFNTDICLVYLFDTWVLNDKAKYIGALIGSFFLALSTQILLLIRKLLAKSQSRRQAEEKRLVSVKEIAINSALMGAGVAIGYWVMLLTMLFDARFFLVVVFGVASGNFLCSLFEQWLARPEESRKSLPTNDGCHCGPSAPLPHENDPVSCPATTPCCLDV